MEALWSFAELSSALGLGAAEGPAVGGVCIDSRQLDPGDLFVALPGDPGPRFTATARSNRDGHDYIADAVGKGAAAVLAHRPGDYGAPTLLVEDTLDGLWTLAAAARQRLAGPVVAVTGSSGKTTFKSFAAKALGAFATAGSLNNHIGVPLSLARCPRRASGAVCEIGTNHPGEIEPLSQLAMPHAAVLLNVHPAHIENFGSLDAIRREKTSIARGLVEGGVFVRAAEVEDDGSARTITFGGAGEQADVVLLRLRETDGEGCDYAHLATPSGSVEAPVPGGGLHRARSVAALAALLVALELPMDRLQRLADLDVPRGRGNRVEAAGIRIVDESYNANPASMAATLSAFVREGGGPAGRLVAVLGDMLELGDDAERYHRELADHCAGFAGVYCVGARMEALYRALPANQRLGWAATADDAFVARLAGELKDGDGVLVKGSNGVFWSRGFVDALVAALGSR